MGVFTFVAFLWSLLKVTFIILVDAAKLLYKLLVWLFETTVWLVEEFIKFLGPVYNSVRGSINEKELYRVITLAMSVGTTFWGGVEYVYTHMHEFVTNPVTIVQVNAFVAVVQKNWLFAVVPLVVFVGDLVRRKYFHGTELVNHESV